MNHALRLAPIALASLAACAAPRGDEPASSPEREATAPAPGPAEPAPEPTPPAAGRPLEETDWRLVEVAGKPAVAGPGTRAAAIVFERESASVHGNGGVNTFFGPYALDGDKLRIENLALTRMAGPPELSAQETAFVAALQAARAWRVTGDQLTLLDAQQNVLARLAAASDR